MITFGKTLTYINIAGILFVLSLSPVSSFSRQTVPRIGCVVLALYLRYFPIFLCAVMEIFNSEQVANVLCNKRVMVIGDSIQRSIYKDIIRLLVPDPTSTYLTNQHLKTKGELEFLGDKLLEGGQLGEMKNGINYREVRQFNNESTVIRFYFVTRCHSDYMKSILHGIKCMRPHAIIMNSCLWDLHRYGLYGPLQYVDNMHKLMAGLKKVIPSDAVFIWNATLPLDSKCRGGFLLPYYENIPAREIIEANFIAADIVQSYGFVFLDLYSVLVHRIELRENDGIHWNAFANRIITSHILILLSYAWNRPIPKPMIQDPLVHHPHSVFSNKVLNNRLVHSIGTFSPMRSDSRNLSSIPTVHDPLRPLSEFSHKHLTYYPFSDWRSVSHNNDDYTNRLILKNIENSTRFVRDFPFSVNHTSSPAEILALMRCANQNPLMNNFFTHPPTPLVSDDRHIFRLQSPSVPEVSRRQVDSLHREPLRYHRSALSFKTLPFPTQ